MTETIVWRPHLSTLANSIVVLAMAAWLCWLYARYRSLYGVKKSWLLTVPKILIVLLMLIALLDPCWRVVRPRKGAQKVALLSDVSTSMDVEDGESGSRAARARRIAEKFNDELGDWVDFKQYRPNRRARR